MTYRLKQNGDVENYTITGPGGGTESSKNDNIFVVGYDDDVKELKKTVLSTKEIADMYTFVEENEPDYISAMGILGSYAYRVKICE